MFKSTLFLFVSSIALTVYAKSVSFIDPCKWENKECLIRSAQKALPYFADGVPDLGMSPLDPLEIDTIAVNEGGLSIEFKNIKIERLKECQVMDVEGNTNSLSVVLECPITIQGDHKSSGKIFSMDTLSDGPFYIKSEKVSVSVKMGLKTVDDHWKISNVEHTYDFKEKAELQFENIFNGDESMAAPIRQIIDNQWKEIVQSFGAPIVAEVVNKVVIQFKKFTDAVPASELVL